MPAVSSFVGRADDLAELGEAHAAHRLVTVTGPGGVGKSRLVSEAMAAGIVRDAASCTIPTEPDGAGLAEVAAELGWDSLESAALAASDGPATFVLDGCERAPAVAALAAATLLAAGNGIRVVATSREPLRIDGEHLLVLHPLPLPPPGSDDLAVLAASPAVTLLATRAAAAGAPIADDRLAAAARLAARLDGLPLAIELAAPRLRTVTIDELDAMLRHRIDVLRRPHGTLGPPSMGATLDASYEALAPDDQALLRALSAFEGYFALDMVQAVCAPPGSAQLDTLDALTRLVECSLVVVEHGAPVTRYRLLVTVRLYASAALDAAGEREQVNARFVDGLAAMADAFVAEATQRWSEPLVARMLGCVGNIVRAIDLCVRHDADAARAFRLFLPLYLAAQGGRQGEVAQLGRRMVERWPDGDEPLRAEALAVAAFAALQTGDDDTALELAARGEGLPASDLAVAIVERVRGFAAHYRGEPERAVEHFDTAAARAARTGGPLERDVAVILSMMRCCTTADPSDALSELDRLATAAGGAGERTFELWARVAAAHVRFRLGSNEGARRDAQAVAELGAALPWGFAAATRLLAVMDTIELGWEPSLPSWDHALAAASTTGDLQAAALTIRYAAAAAIEDGHRATAARLVERLPRGAGRTILPDVLPDASSAVAPLIGTAAASITDAVRFARALVAGAPRNESSLPHTPPARSLQDASRATPDGVLIREGDAWRVTYAGASAVVRDVKGIRDLAQLLSGPNRDVHCVELMGGTVTDAPTGEVIDDAARRAYEARIRELQADLDEATAHHDPVRAERVETELDALVDQLTSALGLGGRRRTGAGHSAERARSAVRWRVRAAISKIGDVHPELGRHLRNSVVTGAWCSYRPERETVWQVVT